MVLTAKNILLVKYRFIGDAILAFPAFKAMRDAFPDANIDILTEPVIAELLRGNQWGIRPIIVDSVEARSLPGIFRLALKLRKSRYDVSLNFIHESTIRDSLLPLLAGIPVRAGFSVRNKGFFFNPRVFIEGDKFISRRGHMTDINLKIPLALGVKAANPVPELNIVPEEAAKVTALLAERGVTRPIVGINPGSRSPRRRWPLENYAEVVRFLLDNYPVDVVWAGAPGEAAEAARLAGLVGRDRFFDLTGTVNIRGLIALVGRMRLLLSNDTATAHIGAALGTPLIVLFGCQEDMWLPRGTGFVAAVRDTSADPGYRIEPGEELPLLQGLKNITPGTVIEAIKKRFHDEKFS